MALDPRIILGIQQPQYQSPMNALAKAMELQGMQQQNQLGTMRMEEMRRQQAEAERAAAARNALLQQAQGLDLTTPEGRNALLRAAPLEAPALVKPYLDMDKATADVAQSQAAAGSSRAAAAKTEQETKAARQAAVQKAAQAAHYVYSQAAAAKNPQAVQMADQAWKQAVGSLVKAGILPPEDANGLESYDPAQFQRFLDPEKERAAAERKAAHDLAIQSQKDTSARGWAQINETKAEHGRVASREAERLKIEREKLDKKDAAKPLPPAALKMQNEALDKIGVVGAVNADLGKLEAQIAEGKLNFGPVSNLVNQGRNLAGMSSEGSRNLATFRSSLERLRNESLRLNSGVQTEGDAQRAWNELFQSINDTELVKQRLAEIQALNTRASGLQRMLVDQVRANYGADPVDTTAFETQNPAVGAGGTAFASEAEAAAAAKAGRLKSGTRITINGVPGTWRD